MKYSLPCTSLLPYPCLWDSIIHPSSTDWCKSSVKSHQKSPPPPDHQDWAGRRTRISHPLLTPAHTEGCGDRLCPLLWANSLTQHRHTPLCKCWALSKPGAALRSLEAEFPSKPVQLGEPVPSTAALSPRHQFQSQLGELQRCTWWGDMKCSRVLEPP